MAVNASEFSTQRHKGLNKARAQRTANKVSNHRRIVGFYLTWLSFVVFVLIFVPLC
jgi:uncharacterized membrane protein YecN with MAPEG domain